MTATPEGFVFALKAHMRITHLLRLKESEFTQVFFRAIDPLRATRRLGPVLFQLPPNFKAEPPTARGVPREALPSDIRCAFEFRNKTWLTDEVYTAAGEARRRAVPGRIGEVRSSRSR